MKKVAYLLAVCLVGLSCMTAQPAFAAETHSSIIRQLPKVVQSTPPKPPSPIRTASGSMLLTPLTIPMER